MNAQRPVAATSTPARRRIPGAGAATAHPATTDAPETPASRVAGLAARWAALRLAVVTAAYAILAVAVTWPLAAHLGDGVFSAVDPVDSIWRVGWGQERLLQADAPARQLAEQAADRLRLSARGYTRTLRVARTMADLAASAAVQRVHVAEALAFRHRGGPRVQAA